MTCQSYVLSLQGEAQDIALLKHSKRFEAIQHGAAFLLTELQTR